MEKREYVKPSVVTENDPKGIVPVAAAAIASGGAAVGFLAGYAGNGGALLCMNCGEIWFHVRMH